MSAQTVNETVESVDDLLVDAEKTADGHTRHIIRDARQLLQRLEEDGA